jgi:hypothetical protein
MKSLFFKNYPSFHFFFRYSSFPVIHIFSDDDPSIDRYPKNRSNSEVHMMHTGCTTLKKSVENWLRSSGIQKIRSSIVPMQNFRSIGGHLDSAAGLQRTVSKLVSRSTWSHSIVDEQKKTYDRCRKNRLIYSASEWVKKASFFLLFVLFIITGNFSRFPFLFGRGWVSIYWNFQK